MLSRQSRSVVIIGLPWIVERFLHSPSVLPDEHSTVPMLLGPDTYIKVHSLLPLHVVLGVPDLANPRLTILVHLPPEVELLLKDKIAEGVRVDGGSRLIHDVDFSFGLRLGAVLDGRLVVAVPGERLAPDLSVVVDFLHEDTSSVGLEYLEHESLLEVPWVLHLDLIGDRVRIVD